MEAIRGYKIARKNSEDRAGGSGARSRSASKWADDTSARPHIDRNRWRFIRQSFVVTICNVLRSEQWDSARAPAPVAGEIVYRLPETGAKVL